MPERQHARRRPRRHARARADVPAARPGRAFAPSGRSPTSSSRPARDDRRGAGSGSPRSAQNQALGIGFKIAMRDLEIRGAGNLLGAEQSGHIAAVGFDAYARILQESMAEMKGEPMPVEQELRIDLPVKAFVPPGWVAQEALRLELYRRISLAARPRDPRADPHRDRRPLRRPARRGRDAVRDRVAARERARARRRGDLHLPRPGAAEARRDRRGAAHRPRGARVRVDLRARVPDLEPGARARLRQGSRRVRGTVAARAATGDAVLPASTSS